MDRVITNYGYMTFKDIRSGEVKKLLQSFDKYAYAAVINNLLVILVDNTIVYSMEIPKLDIDTYYGFQIKDLLAIEDEDTIISNQDMFQFVNVKSATFFDFELMNKYVAVYHGESLEKDEEFARRIGIKAAEGMVFYRAFSSILNKNIMVPIFTGLPGLTKSDRVDLTIFKWNPAETVSTTLLVKYNIFKKKFNRLMSMHFQILDI